MKQTGSWCIVYEVACIFYADSPLNSKKFAKFGESVINR